MDLSPRYRRKHRQTLVKKLTLFSVVLLFLLALAWGFFWIPAFRINAITVDGIVETQKVNNTVNEYLKKSGPFFLPQNNYFLVSERDISKLLEDGNFGVAIVTKQFFRKLSIVFPERQAHFIVCSFDNKCFYVNEDGLVFSEAPQFSDYPLPLLVPTDSSSQKNQYDVNLGNQFASSTSMAFLNKLVNGLPKIGVDAKIIETHRMTRTSAPFDFEEMKIFTPNDWYIYVDIRVSPEKILKDLHSLLQEKIKSDVSRLESIDMRFENKAYYKLKSMVQ